MKIKFSLSLYIAVLSWTSIFVESWLVILRVIEFDFHAKWFMLMFVFVAVISSSVSANKKRDDNT